MSTVEELLRLEHEERQVSAARRKLHERLGIFPNKAAEQRERELSRHRHDLHQRIDALRAELDKMGWIRPGDEQVA